MRKVPFLKQPEIISLKQFKGSKIIIAKLFKSVCKRKKSSHGFFEPREDFYSYFIYRKMTEKRRVKQNSLFIRK